MENSQEYCTQCPNHCHRDSLRCSRGRAYFSIEEGTHQGKLEYVSQKKLTGIAAQFKKIGHMMHHNPDIDNERLCEYLTEQEQQNLEKLLSKILQNTK